MNHENHLQELRMKLEHMQKEPPQNWIGKWAKAIQVKKIERKIRNLEKEIKNKRK